MTPEEKYQQLVGALRCSHNGECDIDALLATEYGQKAKELAMLRFRFEEDPMGAECLEFYRTLGVRKELFTDGNFYSRWAMFTPLHLTRGHKYPLIFWHHGGGNPIETDEFSTYLTQIVEKEQIMVCMLQNTNWDNVERMIPILSEKYAIDPERIYIMGYSQGGQAAHAALLRIPEKLAGVAACGCDAFPLWDNLNVRYTIEELDHLRDTFVPVIQVVGRYEFLNLLPHNQWRDIKLWENGISVNPYRPPNHDLAADPTNPPGKRADKPKPPAHTDPDWWKVQKLNLRLISQGCEPVDPKTCIGFRQTPEDELHYVLGFYGDAEEIREYYGIRHYICDKRNAQGMTAYRYVGVDNSPHWPPLLLAELSWEFLRNYRRDHITGRVVIDPYIK